MDERARAAEAAVRSNPHWYHSIELAPGVVTPGFADLRKAAPRVLPGDLAGIRAVDVGTFDGFWAFEMERRGALVTAVDLPRVDAAEWPPVSRAHHERTSSDWDVELGRGFRIAADALGSRVERRECDVYNLSRDALGGPMGFAFVGAILLHLRDPVRALERVWDTLEPGGRVLLFEPFSPRESLTSPRRAVGWFQAHLGGFTWWYANLAALRAWLLAAGFTDVRREGIHRPDAAAGMRQWLCAMSARRPPGT